MRTSEEANQPTVPLRPSAPLRHRTSLCWPREKHLRRGPAVQKKNGSRFNFGLFCFISGIFPESMAKGSSAGFT